MVTSDTEISLSIDNRKHLPEIAAALSRYADVTVEDDMVVVCVVGDLKWYNVGFEHRIVDSLKDIPVRMISYGDNCDISVVLRRNDKKKALEALNCCVSLSTEYFSPENGSVAKQSLRDTFLYRGDFPIIREETGNPLPI